MHELSLALSLVQLVEDSARADQATQVTQVTLRVGPLAGVAEEALRFAYGLVTANTLLEGSTLEIIPVPLSIFCPQCQEVVVLNNPQRFRCPRCDTPSADIRSGRELEVDTIAVI